LKSYSGSESRKNDTENTHINIECQIMKTFVKLTNLTNRYDIKLHFDGDVEYNPTIDEDIHSRINSHLGCNLFFDTS